MSNWRYKWVSISLKGAVDTTAIKKAEKHGWSPVPPDEMPGLGDVFASHTPPVERTRRFVEWPLDLTRGMRLYRMPESNAAELDAARAASPAAHYMTQKANTDSKHTRWQAAERLRKEGILPPVETDEEWEEARILLEDFFGPYVAKAPEWLAQANRLRDHLGLPRMLPDGVLDFVPREFETTAFRRHRPGWRVTPST